MDINKADEVLELLETFAEVRQKLNRLGEILETGRGDTSKRNIGGFLVSPELYYRIYKVMIYLLAEKVSYEVDF